MSQSKIDICNIALANIGHSSIRTFTENNKRARMCDRLYDSLNRYYLSKFDWVFARKVALLSEIVDPTLIVPDSQYAYSVPNDCLTPRDILPEGSRDWWEVVGPHLYCFLGGGIDVYLRYTYLNLDTPRYSATYVYVLSSALSVRLAPALTQDKDVTRAMRGLLQEAEAEAWETDANIGNEEKAHDDDANKTLFVTSGGN